jgi:hypothetical protein
MKILYALIVLDPTSQLAPIDQIAPTSPSRVEEVAPLPTFETYLECMGAAADVMKRATRRDPAESALIGRYPWMLLRGEEERVRQLKDPRNYRCLKIKVD